MVGRRGRRGRESGLAGPAESRLTPETRRIGQERRPNYLLVGLSRTSPAGTTGSPEAVLVDLPRVYSITRRT